MDAQMEANCILRRRVVALMTIEALERTSGISRYTWRRWLKLRRVPAVRLGRCLRVDEQDYLRFVAANRTPAAREERPR
jgi:hypothetical protein